MFLPTAMMFVVVPILDYLIGEHKSNVDKNLINNTLRRVLSASTVVYVFGFFICLFWMIAVLDEFNRFEWFAVIVSFASAGGVLAAAGHELIHRHHRFKKALGELPFIAFGYWHFTLAHIRNHHAHVATEKDNHAPSKNTSFWKYLYQSYPKSYAESRKIVRDRMRKRKINIISIRNPYNLYFGIPMALMLTFYLMNGITAVLIYIGVCIASILFSEAAFYLEHYGLTRNEGDPVTASHSWDSYHRFSNYQTYMVQRHADHHLDAGSEYIYLKSHVDSHRLPLGYPLLSLLAFFPQPFFKVMNQRIREPSQETTIA
ncbi:fatty acid desaturase [Coraliomargarita sp. W4R72]